MRRHRRMARRRLLRPFLGVVGLVAVSILLLTAGLAATSEPLPPHRYLTADSPLVMAHRGGRALGPESTLFTLGRAAGLGVDVLELDVRLTADGEPVLLHDATVDAPTDGNGPVGQFTLLKLKQLDAGYRWQAADGGFPFRGAGLTVATLEEAFATFPRQLFNLELKADDPELAAAVCASVRDSGMQEQTLVASFHGEAVKHFRRVCPDVLTAATAGEVAWFVLLESVGLAGAFHPEGRAFQVPERLVDEEFVQSARSHNVAVHVWTVNEPAAMRRLLRWRVDGIITDHPDSLIALLERPSGTSPEDE